MSTLHLVFSSAGFNAARPRLQDGDEILLMGDGVYVINTIATHLSHQIYALADDLTLRGIQTIDEVTVVDHAGMVNLTEHHQPIVSWRE